ncbi:MAG: TadE/TadG family type IV pilus assembly protein [Actinomycetota bacterium]
MRTSRSEERGSAVVEFALVLPLLLFLTLALVQVGLLMRDQLLVVQASRAAAREAALDADDERVRAAAERAAPGLEPEALDVSIARNGGRGDPVTASVSYSAAPGVPFVGELFPDSVSLNSVSTARQEFT